MAYRISRADEESPDPLFPGRVWGKGKWPSLQFIMRQAQFGQVYGQMFPQRFDVMMAPYGQAFRYADMKWNDSGYCTPQAMSRNEDVIGSYHAAVAGAADPLPFNFYVPRGMGINGSSPVPNVVETDDPALVFTADFNGEESWWELHISEYNLK